MSSRRVSPIGICLVLIGILGFVSLVYAGIPKKINYQGKLVDRTTGEPLVGNVNIVFHIYDAPSGGSSLWVESQTAVADSAGIISVILGHITPIDIQFDDAAWLEVEVEGEVLSPRRELVTVPYAFHAMNADSLGGITHGVYVTEGEVASVTGDMVVDGTITDQDISGVAEIDPAKIAGTAWTSENDGHASGLNADMVDSLHADAFAHTGHIHDDRYYLQEELSEPATINSPENPVHWTKLKGVPDGFADGTDDAGGTGDGHSLDAADGSPVDAVYVDAEGGVGVGTTTPGERLDVDGNINLSGDLRIRGTTVVSISGTDNTLVGDGAGANNTASYVTAVGDSAGAYNQGNLNTFIGFRAGMDHITGEQNVFLGHLAGIANTTGIHNTHLGAFAGHLSDGSSNTCVGNSAGFNTDGDENTCLGTLAGYSNASGMGNVFIGYSAGFNEMASNKLYIANGPDPADVLIYGDFSTGRIGLGTTSPTLGRLEVLGGSEAGTYSSSQTGAGVVGFSQDGDGVMGISNNGRAGSFVGDVYVSADLGVGREAVNATLDVAGTINADTLFKVDGDTVLAAPYGVNTFVGIDAGGDWTMGGESVTCVGYAAGDNNNGSWNTFVGSAAGRYNKWGARNTAVGMAAGLSLNDGIYNTLLGQNTGRNVTSGYENTFLGAESGYWNDGNRNTFVGWGAGATNYTGSDNVFIGHDAGAIETGSNKLYIANGQDTSDVLIHGDFSSGNVGLGTLNPERRLHVSSDFSNFGMMFIENSNTGDNEASIGFKEGSDTDGSEIWVVGVGGWGNTSDFVIGRAAVKMLITPDGNVGIGTTNPGSNKLYVNGPACGTSAWSICSDVGLKDNIKDIGDALGKVLSLRGVTFDWKADKYPDKNFDEDTHFGVIAQEVEEILPEVVSEGPDGDKAVAYSEIVPVLIESIKDQQEQIEELRAEITELKAALARRD